ncbi:type II toxin-antitoxin system HicA family toxin [Candidatus Gottesmanbacteria bacterium]|nr:type II toxin-antitoxin system HicA family toxin [Candidatus Gottesmanbacteria bacterium]
MTKRQKRLKKLFTNPKSVSFEELNRVLLDLGFTKRQPRSGSSHHIYTKGEIQISVPYKRPYVKEIYVKHVLEIIGGIYEKKS